MQPHGAGAPDNRPARSARLWDRVGSGSGSAWAERLTGPIHAQLAEVLELAPGQRVLDIGCGDGAYFPTIHAAVGPSGDIHGIDASDNMIARARARIAEHSWDNVTAEHADFTRAELDPATYDAALAVFAFSAMSDVPTAVSIAHHALRPGGRLFVVDLRRVPHGRAAPLIHLARLTYRAPSRAGPAPTSSTPSPPRPSPRNHVWPASMPWMSPLGPTAAWMVGK